MSEVLHFSVEEEYSDQNEVFLKLMCCSILKKFKITLLKHKILCKQKIMSENFVNFESFTFFATHHIVWPGHVSSSSSGPF